jgi:predicted nucleic acid-binding protein
MSERTFVDTNVLVYARDASEPDKQPVAAAWLDALWQRKDGRLSVQVLQEYYVTVTAKLSPGLPVDEARRDVLALGAWAPEPVTPDLIGAAWELQDEYRFSFWDSMIVAAATRADCSILLTEDLQHGQQLGGLRVVNPFMEPPG